MQRFVNYWIPPVLAHADAETRRRSELLARCVLVMCAIFPVMSAVYTLHGHWLLGAFVAGFWLLQPLTLIVLKYTQRLTWGAHTCCLLLWGTLASVAAFTGGVDAPVFASNVLLVVLATMLGGERTGRIWTGIVLATLVTTLLRTKLSLGVTQLLGGDALMEFRTAEPAATVIVTFAMCTIYERVKDQMLRRVETERSRAERSHRDVKLILDNTGQGFVTLDAQGVVVGEISAIAQRWLPGLSAGASFAEVIAAVDATVGACFRVAWDQLTEGLLPLELNLQQMPTRLQARRAHYSIEYRVLQDADAQIDTVVVILSDITAQLAQEQAEAEQRELLAVFRRILADRGGVTEFLDEGSQLVDNLVHDRGDAIEIKRWLHTLKGNSGLLGLTRFACLCHELEDALEQSHRRLSAQRRTTLAAAWSAIVSRIRPFLGDHYHGDVVLDSNTYEAFLRRLLAGEARETLAREVQLWSFEALDCRLRRFADRAVALSARLNKGTPQVIVDAGGMRLQSSDWGAFWAAFVHVVRNAVDHGLDTPEERTASGKRAQPTLVLKAYERDAQLVIEVADDGRGVAWDAIAKRAQRLGLPHATPADLTAALFADGVSSRDEVTELSGRGVGLAAVKRACDDLGGAIEVRSQRGRGTQFLFKFPLHKVSAGSLARAV